MRDRWTDQLVRGVFFALLIANAAYSASAAEHSHFIAGSCQSGKLEFIQGLPVATVTGTPEEMGQQLGTLLKGPLGELIGKEERFARGFGFDQSITALSKTGQLLLPRFPGSQRRELEAMVKASGVDLNLLILGNVMYELSQAPACSTLSVESERSAADGPLFGRNLDFPTFGFLDQYSLLILYHPQGKHAFAAVGFPAVVGVFSGMNDAGLCLAQLEVTRSSENSPRVNLLGTPVAMCFRRVLEECTTVDEAEKLLREQNRMLMCNVALCDHHQAIVLEMTTKTVVRRPADHGLCACTNHFRTAGLTLNQHCSRYAKLIAAQQTNKFTVDDLARLLDEVNQGGNTIQTMIFEPASLRIHLSLGPPPSSSRPLKSIDLAGLLKGTAAATADGATAAAADAHTTSR